MSVATGQGQVIIEGLCKTFRSRGQEVNALDNVSLDVAEGEMLVLLGPSGCGKTTLLRCIVGLEQPTAGRIHLAGRTVFDSRNGVFVSANKRDVGMVFQNYALWPHMTVAENVGYPLRARGNASQIAAGRVSEVLAIVQCDQLADRYPAQLSGGQQQRVSLARALSARPAVMLLDEPLSNLDALLRVDMRAQLRVLHRQLDFTGVFVTHDQIEAMNLATRIVVMRAGRIEQIGTPQDVHDRPANEYVAEFLGMRNRLACQIDESGSLLLGKIRLDRVFEGHAPGAYALRMRPSQLALRPAGRIQRDEARQWLSGATIIERLPGGETMDYLVDAQGTMLFVESRDARRFSPGEPVDVGFDPPLTLLYDVSGVLAPVH